MSKPVPVMYMVWSTYPVPLGHNKTKLVRVLDINKGKKTISSTATLNYDDVPLSFFQDDIQFEKKHGRDALFRRITDPDYRPPKNTKPKSFKKMIEMQVNAAYEKLRQEARI